MAALARPNLMHNIPAWGAAASAAGVGMAFVALPVGWIEGAVQASGVAALLPVAEPPLGATARALLALAGGALAATIVWAALYILFGAGGLLVPRPRAAGEPVFRRADAHPDAPPRRPLSVAELTATPAPIGRPAYPEPAIPVPMSGPAERVVPVDLDTPLSALDPAAILPTPMAPVRALPPLAPGERMQTFVLTPPPVQTQAPSEPASIEALLQRLERGAGRRLAAG